MVCEKCEKKLGKVITPDTWKDGARNTTESGGRKLNENKILTSKKARFDPYSKTGFATCRICKSSVHQSGSHYCQGCAYKKGICAMCGKKVLDTKNYKQTSVWQRADQTSVLPAIVRMGPCYSSSNISSFPKCPVIYICNSLLPFPPPQWKREIWRELFSYYETWKIPLKLLQWPYTG